MAASRLLPKRAWLFAVTVLMVGLAGYASLIYGRGSLPFLLCRLAFDYQLMRDSKELNVEARSGLSGTYYFTSYYLNGILSAAEGTGSTRLLLRAMKIMDRMISTAIEHEYQGKVYQAWRPFAVTADSAIARPNLHYTFQSTVPIARAAAVIMTRPKWKAKYEATARRYVAFVDQCIIQYWYHAQLHDSIPWAEPDHFPIWNDNGSNLALNAVYLYQATGRPEYEKICRTIGNALRKKMQPAGRGWIWDNHTIVIGSDTDNTPGSVGNQAGVPDVSHANREAFLMTALHEAGVMFTQADLERMAATLTDTIWNQSADNPSFSNYLNGSNRPYRVYKQPGLNGSIYHGWVLMGGYSPQAQQVMLYTLKAILKGKTNPSLERNITGYGGRLGLCGHTLLNFAKQKQAGASGWREAELSPKKRRPWQ